MKTHRLSKGVIAEYTSFEEMGNALGSKPRRKKDNDNERLESQKKKFFNKHMCPACKKPMTWVGGNIMACTNPDCNGLKHEQVINAETGETKVWYTPTYDLLDETGVLIAEKLFEENT